MFRDAIMPDLSTIPLYVWRLFARPVGHGVRGG